MKAIRRSLKGDKDPKPHHHHLSLTPKSAIAILPPKKVIKALYDYHPDHSNSQELAFSKGDFFHVISREDDGDWYEACNPLIPSARGLVPVSFFEVVGKTERDSSGAGGRSSSLIDLHQHHHHKKEPHDSGFSDRLLSPLGSSDSAHHSSPSKSSSISFPRLSTMGKGSGAMVYGVVQYDFQAERPDELDAKAGEAIIVIALSNPEWFVAKPIGRLGGPGLIPVSFLELRDMQTGQAVTDPLDAVRRAGVPKVEEWKKMTAEYKNSSITLGHLDSAAASSGGGGGSGSGVPSITAGMNKMSMSHTSQNGNTYGYHQRNPSKGTLSSHHVSHPYPQNFHPPPLMAPVAASIPRYCFDNDKYWYIIEAKMEDGRCWELPRYYHDFYDFQIALLTQFEDEAGNRGKARTLPFMPGPVTHVTDAISNGRRQNLDEYIKKLLSMPPHISRCTLVRQLFAPRPGDFEIDPSAFGEDARYSAGSHQSSSAQEASRTASRQSSQVHLSAQPDRASHQRGQGSISQSNGAPPAMNRQPSSLTQVSSSSGNASGGGAMKVKVFFQDDLIAIRVPSDINLQQLKEKLTDRLKIGDGIVVQYKDEPSGTVVDLNNDGDLDTAIQRNSKLTLVVGVA
ncbi:phosphatidylinositol-3-phosphate-binding protein BEM1 [Aspergillus chevalieri]|uniref:Bud emergence protein 1 n=1 Tax=Aspergillus chevalieri TaxID=182096 RepID=A0A7R7VM05_ASPCH|nr:bud emergence protein 1 [Aspergillus chevalieri]BCR87120.1 bud emergence protein 1 [Aspergillus chevalieri]